MKYKTLCILLLIPMYIMGQTTLKKLQQADKEYKNVHYQQILELFKNENLQQNIETLYQVIQAQCALIEKDYNENIVKFDYNRLVNLCENINTYKAYTLLRPFQLEYYKVIATHYKVDKRKVTKSEREQLYNQLKAYKNQYHNKNILYDQAIEAALKNLHQHYR